MSLRFRASPGSLGPSVGYCDSTEHPVKLASGGAGASLDDADVTGRNDATRSLVT